MSFRTVDIEVSRNRLPHQRIEHPQANPLRLRCTLRPGESLPSALEITAEIHTSRNVPAETTPLAATTVTVGADATSFEVLFDSPQTNQTVTPESTRALWLVMYGVGDANAVYTLATADLLLGWHAISRVTPPPPATAALVEKGGVAWVTARQYAAGTMVTVGTTAYVASSAHTSGSTTQPGTGGSWNTVWAVLSGSGGGATNLAAVPSPTTVTILSDTGTDAVIPAADGTNAGVFPAALHTKLTDLPTAAQLVTSFGGKADASHTHATSQVTGLDIALAAKADLISGKLNPAQLPDLAISEDLGTAANQAAMLLLVGQRGDWCTRSDDGRIWIVRAEPSSVLGNWQAMSYPGSPVTSVAGRAGAVTLNAVDIANSTGLGQALLTAANPSAIRFIRINANNTVSLLDAAAFLTAIGAGSGGSKALPAWSARDNQPPATAFATVDTRIGQYVLDFDDAGTERAVFIGIIPAEFSLTGGFKVRVHWWASSINTAHRVKWCAEVERRNTDASGDSWGSVHTALGIPSGTQFVPAFTEIAVTSIDGLVAGEPYRLRISRDAADTVNDTMIGDAEVFQVQVIGN